MRINLAAFFKDNLALVVLTVAAVALAFYSGYVFGSRKAVQSSPGSFVTEPATQSAVIKSIQALATGEVVQKGPNSITLKADNGEQQSFNLSSNLTIYQAPGSASPSAALKGSSNREDIELNKKALVTLEFQGGQYLVTSISYLPEGAPRK